MLRSTSRKRKEEEDVETLIHEVEDYRSLLMTAIESRDTTWLTREFIFLTYCSKTSTCITDWIAKYEEPQKRAYLCDYLFLRREAFRWYGSICEKFFSEREADFLVTSLHAAWLTSEVEALKETLFINTLRSRGVPREFTCSFDISDSEVELVSGDSRPDPPDLIVID